MATYKSIPTHPAPDHFWVTADEGARGRATYEVLVIGDDVHVREVARGADHEWWVGSFRERAQDAKRRTVDGPRVGYTNALPLRFEADAVNERELKADRDMADRMLGIDVRARDGLGSDFDREAVAQ